MIEFIAACYGIPNAVSMTLCQVQNMIIKDR